MIIGIVVVLLILIIGGILAVALLGGKKNNNNTSNNSPTSVPATATQSVPNGFKSFSNSDFSLIYPQDWTPATSSSSDNGETFTSATGQEFEVDVSQGESDPKAFDDIFCSVIGSVTAGPTTVSIAGEQWTQEECEDQDGTLHAVIEAVVHNGNLFSITYFSLGDTYPTDKTQFYQPMEKSFQFKS